MNIVKQALAVATLLLVTISAQAGCSTSDLKGTWHATGVGGELSGGTLDATEQCKLTIGSTGSIIPASSSCRFRYMDGAFSMTVSSSKLSIARDCSVTGSIKVCEDGECDTYKIERSKMDKSKETMVLLGYEAGGDSSVNVISYTAVKQ
jgi:hypothetical protein